MSELVKYRKFIVALAGIVAQIINANVLTGAAAHYASIIGAGLTALLVVAVPNASTA